MAKPEGICFRFGFFGERRSALESEIIALLEPQEGALRLKELLAARDVWLKLSQSPAVLAARRSFGVKDLVRHEQEVKDRLTREILARENNRQEP